MARLTVRWSRFLSLLSALLGVLGFCAIPFIVGLQDLGRTLSQVGWLALGVSVLNAAGTLVMPALGWWVLMRLEGIPAAVHTAVQASFMGFPLDFIVPSAYLGGEPLKTVYVARTCQVPAQRVLATIILAKFQELGALVLGMIVTTGLFLWHSRSTRPQHILLLTLAMAVLVVLLGMLLYAFGGRLQPLLRLLRLLARLHRMQRHAAWLHTLIAEMEHLVYTTLREHWGMVLLAQAITALSTVSLWLRPWIFCWYLPGQAVDIFDLCALFVLTNLVNLLTVVPGGLGWFEATMAGYTSAVGLGDERGAAFALVTRLADVIFLTLGSWLIAHHGLRSIVRSKRSAPEAEP
ncbi:MAG: lysylphosphatidylglycerol synthase transmembrane domain-containing protein [Candidatus Tectimicrobiota bacterium]